MPIAVLYNRKSNMLTDHTGTVINAKYFKEIIDGLPVITGFAVNNGSFRSNDYGQVELCLKPALALISLINTDYADLNVKIVNLSLSNRLVVFLNLANGKQIKILLPFYFDIDAPPTQPQMDHETRVLENKLDELRDVLKYVKQRNSTCSEINLLFKDQAVVK